MKVPSTLSGLNCPCEIFLTTLGNAHGHRHKRLEHMRPMLVKFSHGRPFGICKASALLHPARTTNQKFFGAFGIRVKKSKFFKRKDKSVVNSYSINEHFNALLRKICLFKPYAVRISYANNLLSFLCHTDKRSLN